MLDYQGLLKQISAKKIAPFYLLSGTEAFFIDSIVDSLTKALVDEFAAAFDHTILYGKDTSVSQIIESAKRFPMVSEKQLIVLKKRNTWINSWMNWLRISLKLQDIQF